MRATTFSTPKVSRATRAARCWSCRRELTAANADACSMPASIEHLAVEADAGDGRPPNDAGSRRKALRLLVDDGDGLCPAASSGLGQRRAHPAAAHDHHMHGR